MGSHPPGSPVFLFASGLSIHRENIKQYKKSCGRALGVLCRGLGGVLAVAWEGFGWVWQGLEGFLEVFWKIFGGMFGKYVDGNLIVFVIM